MTRWLLAIHEDTNANATLFRDGVPLFAVAEERLTRKKYSAGFPAQSVRACLDFAGIDLSAIDTVLPANRYHLLPRISPDLLPEEEHDYFGPLHKTYLYFQAALTRGGPVPWLTEQLGRLLVARRFPRVAPFIDHHTAHAHSAWLTSGFDSCVAVTADNMGDGWSSRVFLCRGRRAEFQYGSSARHSPGQFYGEIAQLLGFHNLMAGKVTGLAAHGDPSPAYPIMARLFALDAAETRFLTPGLARRARDRGPYAELRAMRPADVAAAAQKRLEDVMVAYVRRAVRELGERRVVLAGGTFANVAVNRKILALPEVDAIHIHPAMTDQGISMGAGFAHLWASGESRNSPLDSIYLGPRWSEDQMAAALDEAKLRWERPADVEDATARALAAGRTVARYAGRLEYGPRALGNRSILHRAGDPSINDTLNRRLRRTEFMPFAPVTAAEHASDYYQDLEGAELAVRYMTITCGVTPRARERAPAIVHLDGTARPQVVREEDNPAFHRLLARYFELSGSPVLINTSFNMHEEPIVCSPRDAVRAFLAAGLDHLALGPFFVSRSAPSAARGEDRRVW